MTTNKSFALKVGTLVRYDGAIGIIIKIDENVPAYPYHMKWLSFDGYPYPDGCGYSLKMEPLEILS